MRRADEVVEDVVGDVADDVVGDVVVEVGVGDVVDGGEGKLLVPQWLHGDVEMLE